MRHTLANGMRQINLLLIPSAAGMMVLATPIIRLVFQRGEFTATSTHLTSLALFWFAFSLPFAGLNLLLTRTFFALQRPWIPTGLAAINMTVDVIVSIGLYKPLGIQGLVIGTAVANIVMTWLLPHRLRIGFNGRIEGEQTAMVTARIVVASILAAAIARLAVGAARPVSPVRSFVGQLAFGRRRDCGRRRVLRVGGAAHAGSGGATDRATGPRPPAGRARRSLRNVAGGAALLTWVPSPIRRTSATSRSSPTSTMASRRWQIGSSS